MRIDAGVEFPDAARLAALRTILARNRFDDAIVLAIDGTLATLDGTVCGARLAAGAPDARFAEVVREGLACDIVGAEPRRIADVARLLPEARIVAEFPSCPTDVAVLADSPNVAVKICCATGRAVDYREFVQLVLASLGPRRTMFGSGWPRLIEVAIWKQRLAAFTQAMGARSLEAREEILGGTAARFFHLRPAPREPLE